MKRTLSVLQHKVLNVVCSFLQLLKTNLNAHEIYRALMIDAVLLCNIFDVWTVLIT